jgi:hypothetical protein
MMGKLMLNNICYTGSGGGDSNVYGAFIDTNRVIQASTNIPANTDVTYTATEDCCLEFILVADADQGVHVTIDGVYIKTNFIKSGIYTWGDIVYLRRGQTIKMRQSYTASDGSYTVYGLTFGTNNIFTPQIYSLEEREVGVYADGKPLYEKTFLLANAVVNNSTSPTVPCNLTNVERVIYKSGTAFDTNDNRWYSLPYDRKTIEENLFVVLHRLSDETVSIGLGTNQSTNYSLSNIMITIQYTKTTDVAGSGSWAPSGVPAVHYEDNTEQVIGTYNGETLYQISYSGTTASTISILQNIKIKDIKGGVFDDNGDYYIPFSWNNENGRVAIHQRSNGEMTLINNTDRTKFNLIIQYTKTT